MTGLTMLDSILNDQFYAGADAYAAYVDGQIGNQPNYGYVCEAYPKARHLGIALFANHDGDVLDMETGAASPADFPAWCARQRTRGIARPVAYAGAYNMNASVIPMLSEAGIPLSSVRLWSAHYGEGEHICAPSSCGMLRVAADGTQWTQSAQGRVLDQSLLSADFFGAPAPPPPPKPLPADWVAGRVRDLAVVSTGPSSVKLSWVSPGTPKPLGVGWYEVVVQLGGKDVSSYPRVEAKTANPQIWQGGSLKPATKYQAMVRAVATDGGHASPWATANFTTTAG